MKKFKTIEQNYQLDEILEKISNDGISSLNYNEKKYLYQCKKNRIDIRLEKILYDNQEGVYISDDNTFDLLKYEHQYTNYIGKPKYTGYDLNDGSDELIFHKGLLYVNNSMYDCELICYNDGELKTYYINKYFEFDIDEDDDDFSQGYSEDEIKELYDVKHGDIDNDFKDDINIIRGFLTSIVCSNLSQ